MSSFLVQRIEHQKQYRAVGQIAQDVSALKTRQMEAEALQAVFTSLLLSFQCRRLVAHGELRLEFRDDLKSFLWTAMNIPTSQSY